MGLISNMNQNGDELADSMGLLPHLDFSITSQEVGAEKPDPLIFEHALRRAGAQPESAVHVGDQITSDVAGALNAGINAVLLDRDGNHKGYTAQPRITGLTELPELLERFTS